MIYVLGVVVAFVVFTLGWMVFYERSQYEMTGERVMFCMVEGFLMSLVWPLSVVGLLFYFPFRWVERRLAHIQSDD